MENKIKNLILLFFVAIILAFPAQMVFAPLPLTRNEAHADPGIASVDIDYIVDPESTYQTAGVFVSTNLLPASGSELINNFSYIATVPTNTTIKVQFSDDGETWYNSAGTSGGWTTLSTGTNIIDLSARNWKWGFFYYKMFFTSTDGMATPSLDSITLSYNSYIGVYDTYNTSGNFTSTNLLSGLTATSITSFSYNIMSLPQNTGVTAQFSIDNSTWCNSSGVNGGLNTLSGGINTISLAGLNWSGGSFYYKMSLTSDGTASPEIDSVTLNYSAPITFTSTQTGAFNIGTTWGGSCASSCTAGTDFPDTADIAIVANNTIVSLDSARTISTLTVNSGGTLDLAGYNFTSTTFTNSGTLQLQGGETVSTPTLNTGSTVTYTGAAAPVTVKNWSYKTLNLTAPGKELDFTAGATYTVATALNITGTAGNLVKLRSTVDGTQWKLTPPSTVTLSYMDLKDSNNLGSEISAIGANSISSGNNTNWLFDAIAPVTTASGTLNTWTGSSVSVTLTCADNDGGTGCATTKYCLDPSNSCDPVSGETYSTPVTISTEGTSYIRYYSTDTVPNTETTKSSTIKVDTTGPATVYSTTASAYTTTTTLTCTDGSGVGCTYTYYCIDTAIPPAGGCTPTTVYSTPVSYLVSQDTYFRFYSVDGLSNAGTVSSNHILPPGAGGTTVAPPAQVTEPVPVSPPVQTPQNAPNLIEQITQQVQNIANQIAGFLTPGVSPSTPSVVYPPIAESVPEEAQEAFKGWDVMNPMPPEIINNVSSIPSNAEFFAQKLPEFNKVLTDLGLNKIEDASKLNGIQLNLPSITQTYLANSGLSAKGVLGTEAVPLAQFTAKDVEKLPTNIVFANTGNELVDYSIKLTFDEKGDAEQKINVMSGKPLALVIKADENAKNVLGFLTLKNRKISAQTKPNFWLAAALNTARTVLEPGSRTVLQESGTALLLQKFEYKKSENGLYKANITAPVDEGEYEVITIIEYNDPEQPPKETRLVTVVDPEGFIFEKIGSKQARVDKATVSIYWQNSDSKYELWPAKKYMQINPQITNETGKYAFLVPPGKYYLKTEAKGFATYQSEPFSVEQDAGVHTNIQMRANTVFPYWLNLQTVIIALLIILIISVIILIFVIWRRLKK